MVSYGKRFDHQPKLTHHQSSGQGVVRLNARDIYCGRFGTAECKARYHNALAEWSSQQQQATPAPEPETTGPADVTINELLVAYLKHADAHHVKGGAPPGESTNIRYAVKVLREMFGDSVAAEFGPKKLKAVREAIIVTGLCRNEVNRRVRIITRAFEWGVGEELIAPSVHLALATVPGLSEGRSRARESET